VDVPWEVILLLVGGIIWVIQRVAEASREVRRKTVERERKEHARGGADLEEPPRGEPLSPAEARPPAPVLPAPPAPRPAPPRPARAHRPLPAPSVPPPPRRPVVPPAPPRPPAPPPPRPAPPLQVERRVERRSKAAALLLGDPEALKAAVVLREILGPCRARTGWRRSR
jgi:hypothetical protein